jgi:hypothetical protein
LVVAPETAGERLLTWLVTQDDIQTAGSRLWFYARILLQGVVGFFAAGAIYYFAKDRELEGTYAAQLALLISLTGVLLLSFYLDQFSATITALIQSGALLVVVAYRRWYLESEQVADEK